MEKVKKKHLKSARGDLIFYSVMMIWPLLQFFVFYILTRANAILYAFQDYDVLTNTVTWTFSHIKTAFTMMTTFSELRSAMKISLLSFVISTGIGTPLGLLFSYYIAKKLPGSKAFRVILFMPSIISAIVMVTIFQFFVENAIPELSRIFTGKTIKGLIENKATRYGTVMFYNLWLGFGVNVLMYSNAMSGISDEIVESAKLDGASTMKEFFHITLPLIYPTIVTFMITGVAGIFSAQYNLYSFFGSGADGDIITYGYYFYNATQEATSRAEYSDISAIGLYLTLIALPLTLLVKWLMEKFGPSED